MLERTPDIGPKTPSKTKKPKNEVKQELKKKLNPQAEKVSAFWKQDRLAKSDPVDPAVDEKHEAEWTKSFDQYEKEHPTDLGVSANKVAQKALGLIKEFPYPAPSVQHAVEQTLGDFNRTFEAKDTKLAESNLRSLKFLLGKIEKEKERIKKSDAKEVRERVAPLRKLFLELSAQEAEKEKAHEKQKALEETISILRTAAADAQQQGKGEEAKKYGEAILELGKRARRAGQKAEELSTQHQFGAKAERVTETPLDVEAQIEEHGVVDLGNKEPTLDEREQASHELNMQDIDARRKTLRTELDERVATEMEAGIKKAAMENVGNLNGATPEETTPEQWETHYKDAQEAKKNAESFGYVVSPEKMIAAAQEIVAERGAIIDKNTPEQHKGFMRSLADKYRAAPRWQKALLGASLLAGGTLGIATLGPASVLSLWFANKALFLGALITSHAATERWKNRFVAGVVSGGVSVAAAFAIPGLVEYVDNNFLHTRDKIPLPQPRPAGIGEESPLFDPNPKPGAPTFVGMEHLFDQPIVVTADDSAAGLWGIMQDKLTDANIIDTNTPQTTINKMISALENHLREMGPEKIKELGFPSGQIGKIYPGDTLRLGVLNDLVKHVRLYK